MKSSCATICYPSYKIRCFLSVFFLAFCALSLSAYSVGDDSAPDTTAAPPDTPTNTTAPPEATPTGLSPNRTSATATTLATTIAPTTVFSASAPDTTAPPPETPTGLSPNRTSATATTIATTIAPTTVISRSNPCDDLFRNQLALETCNRFFNNETAAGETESFETARVVTNASELVSAVESARPGGTIIVLAPGTYTLTKVLKPAQRIALVGIKSAGARAKITANVDLAKTNPNGLVHLQQPKEGSSAGFYSAFINWETNVISNHGDANNYSTIFGENYPGEIRLYDNIFTQKNNSFHASELVYLSNKRDTAKKIVIDSNQFNTSNIRLSAVYSETSASGRDQDEIIITNNVLSSESGASSVSDNAFRLTNHKKFTIKNNISLSRRANASIVVELLNQPGVQGSIEDNIADPAANELNRLIKVEVAKKTGEEDSKVTGVLAISGNDYFVLGSKDEKGAYITFTQGKKIPAEGSPLPICGNLSRDAAAFKICNDFLNNSLATGGDKNFSHAFAVSNAEELLNAVERYYPDDSGFTGSIIVLRAGTYLLPRQLITNHKLALVGEKSGDSFPKIKATNEILLTSRERLSLVDLRNSSSEPSSGFYSAHIKWDTGIDNIGDIYHVHEAVSEDSTISGVSYSGKIRIFDNYFMHHLDTNNVRYFLMLNNFNDDAYIGHNTFDSTRLKFWAVAAQCADCSELGTKMEVVSNRFISDQASPTYSVAHGIELRGYKQFRIENNRQENSKAAAKISVFLKDNTGGVSGVIRNNTVSTSAPGNQRMIRIESYMLEGLPHVTGSLIVAQNSGYTFFDPDNLMALIGLTVDATTTARASTTTQPLVSPSQVVRTSAPGMSAQAHRDIASSTTPLPTRAIASSYSVTPTGSSGPICDRMQSTTEVTASEIDACKAFLNNNKASGGHSFSLAVVVSNARELDAAVTGKFPKGHPDASRLVVLKSGTYPLTEPLDITRKVALVGVLKDGEYPTIKVAEKRKYRFLANLHHNPKVAETGFYSHHIHWDISSAPFFSFFFGFIKKRAIYSNSYQGDIRIYENKFSEARLSYINSYIELRDAIGGAFIEDNRFDTAYLTECTIIARCESEVCRAAEPPLDVSDNHFYIETAPSPDALEFLKRYRKEPPKSICVLGYMRFRIAGNQQKTKDATGSIILRDHYDVKRLHGYVLNNIAHKDAPELQRRIIYQSYHFAEHYLRVTGKLHVSGNDYYTFDESGLAPSFVDYSPGKQVIVPSQTAAASSTVKAASSANVSPDVITPSTLISATASVRLPAKKKPCNDILEHPTAFATCEAFLQNELASGPAANKPAFSHAMVVSTTSELIDAINKTIGYDGKPVSGRIILLEPDTYELSKALLASHRVAMVGLKSADGLPVITAARDFSGSQGPNRSLLYLKAVSNPVDTGFYSWNLEWRTRMPYPKYFFEFQAFIFAEGYNGDIRIYQNRFSDRNHYISWPLHSVVLNDNAGYAYYVGHNIFDTEAVTYNVIESTASPNSRAAIEVDANEFRSVDAFHRDRPNAIVLADYQQLKINNNIQKDSSAAGAIKVGFKNNQRIESASIKNNRAHIDASGEDRTIELKLNKKSFDERSNLSGYVEVTGNDYYELALLDVTDSNYRYTAGLDVATARLAHSKSTVTPSLSVTTAGMRVKPSQSLPTPLETTVVSSVTAGSTPSSLPPLSSPCDQLIDSDKAQLCQRFLNELEEMNIRTTFSEVVIVKNTWELLHEVDMTSESGKVILLQAGSYELYEQLRVVRPVALVGIGNTVIKQAVDYPAEEESLVLLDYASTGLGFFSKGITWDISAADSIRSNPLSTAVKAVDYRGKLVMSGDEFQYNAIRENEKAPSHYVEVRGSSGDVIITGSTFFSGGLKKAAIYADCKDCLEEVQKMDISDNRFTDSNSGESAPSAIDVRHYRILKVHDNVQETESVSVNINVELPNNRGGIFALIVDNIAMGSAIDEKKTIDVTVGRLAKEPARIDGLVRVYSNRCFSVNLDEIPSDVVEFAEGNCSALPNIQALRGAPTPSHNGLSTGQWVGIGFAVGAAAVYGGCGLYGLTNLPGHARAWSFFILPKTLALAATAKVLAWCNQRKWRSLSEDDDAVSYSPSAGVEMKTALPKEPEMNLGESEGDQFPLIENPIVEGQL